MYLRVKICPIRPNNDQCNKEYTLAVANTSMETRYIETQRPILVLIHIYNKDKGHDSLECERENNYRFEENDILTANN